MINCSKSLINYCMKISYDKNIQTNKIHLKKILSRILNINYEKFLSYENIYLSDKKKKKFLRNYFFFLNSKPLSKIFGYKEFYSNEFFVSKNCLDPRPDSELLVSDALDIMLSDSKKKAILELGVGSGCVLISLILELKKKNKKFFSIGSDICDKALEIAKKNVRKFNLTHEIRLISSDWFDNIKNNFDLIVVNPPYIKSNSIRTLDQKVRNFDPLKALDGGKNGLEKFELISQKINLFLKKEGKVLVEVGYNQSDSVIKIFEKQRLKLIKLSFDINGVCRCLTFGKN